MAAEAGAAGDPGGHARTTTGRPRPGIEAHFRAVAAATDLPVLLYDIPVRTGRKISHETLLQPGPRGADIVGVKDAAGDPAGTARLVAEAPDGLRGATAATTR